jgi:hypothetical protein
LLPSVVRPPLKMTRERMNPVERQNLTADEH